MRREGLEPSWTKVRTILSRVRLPISPSAQNKIIIERRPYTEIKNMKKSSQNVFDSDAYGTSDDPNGIRTCDSILDRVLYQDELKIYNN